MPLQPITPSGYEHITNGHIQIGDKYWFWNHERFADVGTMLPGTNIGPGDGRYIIRKAKEVESIKIKINKNPKGFSKLARIAIKKSVPTK